MCSYSIDLNYFKRVSHICGRSSNNLLKLLSHTFTPSDLAILLLKPDITFEKCGGRENNKNAVISIEKAPLRNENAS